EEEQGHQREIGLQKLCLLVDEPRPHELPQEAADERQAEADAERSGSPYVEADDFERSPHDQVMALRQIGEPVLDGQEYEHEENYEHDRRLYQHAAQIIQVLDKRRIRILYRHPAPLPCLFISVVADGFYRIFSVIVIRCHHVHLLFPLIRKKTYTENFRICLTIHYLLPSDKVKRQQVGWQLLRRPALRKITNRIFKVNLHLPLLI